MNIRTATIRPPRRRIYSPATMKRKPARRSTAWAIRISRLEAAGMIAAFVLFGVGLWTSYEVNRISADITQLQNEQTTLMETASRLEQQKKLLLSEKNLAPLGTKLGLHPAKPGQTVTLN